MSTLGHAFAALVVRLSNRLDLQAADLLAFPSFQTRLSLDQVKYVSNPEKLETTDGADATRRTLSIEGFSRLVNHIPTGRRDFVLSGPPLWEIYQQTLQSAETAAKPIAEADRAVVEFEHRRETMTINRRKSVSGISDDYWAVGVDPIVDLRDAQSWTRITLDPKAIAETTNKVPKDLEEWLQARDLMRTLDDVEVGAVTIEACHLSIRRSWFDQTVFNATNWRLRGADVLSDGGNPPVGLLPAFVDGVVLIRKLEVELEPVTGGKLMLPVTPHDQPVGAPATLMLNRAFVAAATLSLESFARKPRPKPGVMSLTKTGAETATAGFPSPVIIKAQSVIEGLEKNVAAARLALGNAGQQLAAHHREIAKAEARILEIQKTLRNPPKVDGSVVRDNRPSGGVGVKSNPRTARVKGKVHHPPATTRSVSIDLRPLRAELAKHTNRISVLKAEILKAEASQRSLNESLEKWSKEKAGYEALPKDPFGADEVFLFAVICRRTPKSPKPAPDLFSS